MEKTRVRGHNFSPQEKELLFNLITKYKHIIENKKTDGATLEEKNQSWKNITSEFNCICPNLCTRSEESLRKLYKNQKKDLKKKLGEHRKNLYLTGGGPQSTSTLTENDNLLLEVVDNKTVFGLHCPVDSDSVLSTKDLLENTNNEQTKRKAEENKENWKKYKPTYLKQSTSSELRLKKNSGDEPNFNNIDSIEISLDEREKRIEKDFHENVTEAVASTSKKQRLNTSRRRPTSTITLTLSALGEKYSKLVDQKLELMEGLKKEHLLRVKSLELDIEIKKKTLESDKKD